MDEVSSLSSASLDAWLSAIVRESVCCVPSAGTGGGV